MGFDIDGARKSGYSDAEIADFLAKDNSFDASGARKAGYSDGEIIGHLTGTTPSQQQANVRAQTTADFSGPEPSMASQAAKGTFDSAGLGEGGTIRTAGDVAGATPEGFLAIMGNLGGKLVKGISDAAAKVPAVNIGLLGAKVGGLVSNSVAHKFADETTSAANYATQEGRDRVATALADPTAHPIEAARYGASQAVSDYGKAQQDFYAGELHKDAPAMERQNKTVQDADGFWNTVATSLANPLSLTSTVAQSFPDMAAGMGISRAAMLGKQILSTPVGKQALAAGEEAFQKTILDAAGNPATFADASKLAAAARQQAIKDTLVANQGALEGVAGGAGLITESVQSGGNTRANVIDFVNQRPDMELQRDNADYRDLRIHHSEEEAKAMLGAQLGNQVSGSSALWTGAMGKVSGAADAWGHTVGGGKVTGRQALGGTLKEGGEELLQNPGEDYAKYQAQVQADPTQTFDVGGSMAQGLMGGLAQGGGMHGAGYVASRTRTEAAEPAVLLAGRPVTGYTDAQLKQYSESGVLTAPVKEKVDAEIARRAQPGAAPAQGDALDTAVDKYAAGLSGEGKPGPADAGGAGAGVAGAGPAGGLDPARVARDRATLPAQGDGLPGQTGAPAVGSIIPKPATTQGTLDAIEEQAAEARRQAAADVESRQETDRKAALRGGDPAQPNPLDNLANADAAQRSAGVRLVVADHGGSATSGVSHLESARTRNDASLVSGRASLAKLGGSVPDLQPIQDRGLFRRASAVADAIESVTGSRPVLYHDTRSGAADGFEHNGVAYVNAGNLEQSLQHTVFHETFHVAERRARQGDASAQQFVKTAESIFDMISQEGRKAYAEKYLFKHQLENGAMTAEEALAHPKLKSEMIADFFGQRGNDAKFIRHLAQRSPEHFGGFARRWIDSLTNMIQQLRGSRGSYGAKDIDQYIQKLSHAKAVAASALIQWRRDNPRFASNLPAPGETLRPANARQARRDDLMNESGKQGDEQPEKKDLAGFAKNLRDRIATNVEYGQMLSRRHEWRYNVGDVFMSTKTGKTYTLSARTFQRVGPISKNDWQPVYYYENGEPPPKGSNSAEVAEWDKTHDYERGTFQEKALVESKTMKNLTTPRFSAKQYDVLEPGARTRAEAQLAPQLKLAEEAKPEFDRRLINIANQLGGEAQTPPVKGMQRAAVRLVVDHKGDNLKTTDLLRGSVVVPSLSDIPAAMRAVGANFPVVRTKDRFSQPTNDGYRDVLMNVRMPNGLVAEVQIHTPETAAARQAGHGIYEDARAHRAAGNEAAAAPLDDLTRQLHGQAYQKALGGAAPAFSSKQEEGSAEASKTDALTMVAQRGERVTGKRAAMSAEEKTAITNSSEATGVSEREIKSVVRGHKLANPPSQGWAPLVFTGAQLNDKGKIEYAYQAVPYTFSSVVGSTGKPKALVPGTPEYKRRVTAVSNGMVDEVRRVYRRAMAGDKNAQNILAQAGWYKAMRARLRQEFGGLGDLFADLLGATSPNTPVRDNWTNAVDSLRRAMRGDYDELMPKWVAWVENNEAMDTRFRAFYNDMLDRGMSNKDIKALGEYKWLAERASEARKLPPELLPTKESDKLYGFNGKNVVRAMVDLWRTVKNPDADIRRGGTAPKALNFSGNLIGFRSRATIDVWAARMLQRLSGGIRIPSIAETSVSGKMHRDGTTTLQFGFGQDVFTDAASRIRDDPEMKAHEVLAKINDDDLQAVVWFIEKELWTVNNWTSSAGEGGSFELEASLTGNKDQERIRVLRQILDAKGSTPAAKAKARTELASLERSVDRYTGGLSEEMSAENQGVSYVPTDSDMARLGNDVRTSIYEADDGATVLASKTLSTEGRFGAPERALDFEVISRQGYNPTPLWKTLLQKGDKAKQMAVYLSRVLRAGETYDPLVHRPGVEIYFREAAARAKLEEMLDALKKEGVDFLTVIVDGRRSPKAMKGAMPSAVGVRLQYVPEFMDQEHRDDLARLSPEELAARIEAKADEMAALAEHITATVPGVSFAGRFWHETHVAFRQEYKEKLDGISAGIPEGAAGQVAGPQWAGQSVRAGLEGADRYAREAARRQPDGDWSQPGGSAVGGDEGGIRQSGKQRDAGDGSGRDQGGSLAPLPGAPAVQGAAGPDPRLTGVAHAYAAERGIQLRRQAEYVQVDPERAARIAAAYDAMPHAPNEPRVKAAYADLIQQTTDQFHALEKAGYKFTFFDGATDPYQGNPWNAMRDLRANKRMAVYGTYDGYGTEGVTKGMIEDNPMLADTGMRWPDQKGVMHPVLANDLFRAVHDAFGHGLEGAGFRAQGEENAWQAHARMFTGDAVGAITSETRGQNSWLNYGPYGEKNRAAKVEDTVFADQKTGLMPEWTWTEGRVGDEGGINESRKQPPVPNGHLQTDLPEEGKIQAGRRVVQDQHLRMRQLREWATESGARLTPASDAYATEERMHGRMASKIEDFREKTIKPLVEKTQAAGFTMDQVAEVLHAEHARERNEQVAKINPKMPDAGSGMATADARAILARTTPELRQLARQWQAITIASRDVLLKAGIISQDMADRWDATYKHYVPLKGGDEEAAARTGTGQGLSVNGKQKRAMGHNARDEHIVENILQDYERSVMLAEKNRVGQSMMLWLTEMNDPRVGTVSQPVKRATLMPTRSYDVRGGSLSVATFDTRAEAEKFIRDQIHVAKSPGAHKLVIREILGDPTVQYRARPQLEEHEAMVYVKGQAIRMQLNDPKLAQSYKKLNADGMNRLIAMSRAFQTYLSRAYTGYNPAFIFRNMIRDFGSGAIKLTGNFGAGTTAKIIAKYPSSLASMLRYSMTGKSTPAIDGYRSNGGSTGAAWLGDMERIGLDIQRDYERYQGVMAQVKQGKPGAAARVAATKVVGSLVGWIEHLNAATENAMRLATYQEILKETGSPEQAASAAKNSTVNFNRKGEKTSTIAALYLFANPNIQDSASVLETLFRGEHKYQAQAICAAMTALSFTAAALQFGGSDDDYEKWKKLSDYTRDKNLVIRLFDKYVTIPVAFGFGFFHTLGNSLFMASKGESINSISVGMAANFLDHFSPVGNPLNGAKTWGTINGKGLVELTPGLVGGDLFRDLFRWAIANRTSLGGDIVPDSKFDEGRPNFLRENRSTKGTAFDAVSRGLSDATGGTPTQGGKVDVSPETLKFWFGAITGGTGTFISDAFALAGLAARAAVAPAGEDISSLKPEMHEIPIAKDYVREEGVKDARRAFWEAANEAKLATADFKRANKAGDEVGAARVYDEKAEILALAGLQKSLGKMISAHRDQVEQINADKDSSLAFKRAAVARLEKEETGIYNDFLRAATEAGHAKDARLAAGAR